MEQQEQQGQQQQPPEIPKDWQYNKSMMECIKTAIDHQVACDITFVLYDGMKHEHRVPAHRLLLALRSPVFFAMFYGDLAERGEEVKVKDVSVQAFHEVIRFIYKDKAQLTLDNASAVLYAAKKYLLPGLSAACARCLEGALAPETASTVLQEALAVGEDTLADVALQLIMARTQAVFASPGWTSIEVSTLDRILDCASFSVSEAEVFSAVMAWLEATAQRHGMEPTPQKYRLLLGNTLYKVQMGNLSLDEFSQLVTPTGLLSEVEELKVFRLLTNPAGTLSDSPFATGRKNRLSLLKPLRLLPSDVGECNFDSELFTYTLHTLIPRLRLEEVHVYDILGPHQVNITLVSGSSNSSRTADTSGSQKVDKSYTHLDHSHAYKEKTYDVFVFKLKEGIDLTRGRYTMTLQLVGEFDTMVYEAHQYGDKNLTIIRKDKESPLFALGYTLHDDVNGVTAADSTEHVPAQPTTATSGEPAPPLPPRKDSTAPKIDTHM